MAHFLLKFRNFRYLGNMGWCDTNFACTVKSADPENPMFCVRISFTSKVIANFLLKFGKFSLPSQQGSVSVKFDYHSLIGRPRKPYERTKNDKPLQAKL